MAITILRAPFTADTWRRTLYGATSLPSAALCFALVVPGLLAGTALLVVFLVGVPIFLLFLTAARFACAFERMRVRGILGIEITAPPALAPQGGLLRRFRTRICSSRTWLELLFLVLNAPISLAMLYACVYPWVQTAYSLSYPIVQWNTDFSPSAWGGETWIGAVTVHTLPGFVALFLGPWLIKGATSLHASWVNVMIGSRLQTSQEKSLRPDRCA
jgi:hypothetical protein